MNKKQVITACVFLQKDGKVFIGKRAMIKSFLPGKWELPGGHIEFGETLEEGLKRELMEELKMEIELDRPYAEFTYVMNDGNDHVIEVLYFATIKNPEQEIIMDPEAIDEYRWITESEIGKYFYDNDSEGNVIRKGFQIIKSR